MPITISDVAKEAGVSTSTVSKVLNNWSTISPATTERVNAVIKRLQYTPNAQAVSFARQSSRNIAFITYLEKDAAFRNPHMFDIMSGAYTELAKNNFTMSFVDTSLETDCGETVSRIIHEKRADGIIVHASALNPEIASHIIEHHFPHIIIGHPGPDRSLCWIDIDQALAGQFAAKHMLDCGYSDVAFIGGKKSGYISARRYKGFLSTMYDYGYQVPESRIIFTDSSINESYRHALDLLSADKRPRAIICENHFISLGVVKAAEELGFHIPEDIAFLTFDIYPYSQMIEPSPTLVDINVHDIGIQAGIMLLRKIKNPALLIQSYTTLPIINLGDSTKILR